MSIQWFRRGGGDSMQA